MKIISKQKLPSVRCCKSSFQVVTPLVNYVIEIFRIPISYKAFFQMFLLHRLPIHAEKLTEPDVDDYVVKSIVCARFLQSILQLCPSFRKCCCFNNSTDDWMKICDLFTKCTYKLWRKWLEDIVKGTEKRCTDLLDLSPRRRIQMMIVSIHFIQIRPQSMRN